jgi:hypothetical protein
MTEEVHDTSHLDRYLQTRQRVSLLNASWRPMLAGAVGAALVIGAVWVATPHFTTREVEIEHLVQHDVPFDNHVPQDKPFDNYIPRVIALPPIAANPPSPLSDAPRSPAEHKFKDSPEWRGADVRGRIVRADQNGFVLATEDGGETGFYPARLGADGKPERNESMTDVVDPYLSDLAYCRPSENGTYLCVALHGGREVPIPQVPITRERARNVRPA